MRPSKVVTGSSGTHKRKAFNLAVQFKSIWPEIIFIYPWENSGGKSVLIVSSLRPFCRHLTGFDVEKEKKKKEKKSNSRGNGSMIYIYIYISYSSETNPNRSELVLSTKESKLSIALISDSWPRSYAFSSEQLFKQELYNSVRHVPIMHSSIPVPVCNKF